MLPPVFKPIVKMLVPAFAIQASCDVSVSEGVVPSVCAVRGTDPRDAPENERGRERGQREPRSHNERPMTASPAGRRRKPNDS